ncbi:MAG: hypothetical protein ACU837_09665 [Gammaproteobacteria bacterium]
MGPIARIVIDICLFQKGPQDLPFSRALLYLSVLAFIVSGFLLLSLSTGVWDSVLQLLAEILLMYGFTWGTLNMANRPARLYQTATALFATDTFITLCAVPVFWAVLSGQTSPLYSLLTLALMLWHWSVIGHIFRHALSTSLAFGLCLALLYIVGSYQLMALLFSGS